MYPFTWRYTPTLILHPLAMAQGAPGTGKQPDGPTSVFATAVHGDEGRRRSAAACRSWRTGTAPSQGWPLVARMMAATASRTAARSRDSVPIRARRAVSTIATAVISTTLTGLGLPQHWPSVPL